MIFIVDKYWYNITFSCVYSTNKGAFWKENTLQLKISISSLAKNKPAVDRVWKLMEKAWKQILNRKWLNWGKPTENELIKIFLNSF